MSTTDSLRKLNKYKKNPDLIQPLTPNELADLVVLVLGQVQNIEKFIETKRLDLDTKFSKQIQDNAKATEKAQKALQAAVRKEIDTILKEGAKQLTETSTALERRVAQAIENIRDGDDGIITDEEIERAAEIASTLIDLPDFEEMVRTEITANPEPIRNALELLQGSERYKVEQADVEGLPQALQNLWDAVRRSGQASGGIGKNQVYNFIRQAVADGTIPAGGGSSISVDGSEVSDPDFISTGDVDFEASGSDVTGDVKGIYGNPLDSTVGSPSDGNILVYRDAGNDWVLEAKPAGGSNPALNDVTDVTISSVTDNEVLAYDNGSSTWINQTPAEAGLAAASHTHTASDVTDFDTEVSNNTDVAANTTARHDAVTVTDSSEIDFTLTGQDITASIIAGSIDETKLDTSVNASLDLADSSVQPGDNVSTLTNDAGYTTNTGTVDTSGTPVANDFARFTDADTIEGRSKAEVLADLDLEIGTDVQAYDAELTQIAALADPNADRILFWDDSAGTYAFLQASTGLTLSGTTLTARAASTTQTGIAEASIASEVNTGTDTARYVSPDSLAGSYAGTKSVQIDIFGELATGDGQAKIIIPSDVNGMNLIQVEAHVGTSGTTGTTDIQIRNATDAVDVLSTKLTIDSGETSSTTAATAAVINTSNDDAATSDVWYIDIDAVSTTAPEDLSVRLTFRLP